MNNEDVKLSLEMSIRHWDDDYIVAADVDFKFDTPLVAVQFFPKVKMNDE